MVEGIAEALLLRTLAEQIVFPEELDAEDGDGPLIRRLRRLFGAITIVAVGGEHAVGHGSVRARASGDALFEPPHEHRSPVLRIPVGKTIEVRS